jgi:hypothetical protein
MDGTEAWSGVQRHQCFHHDLLIGHTLQAQGSLQVGHFLQKCHRHLLTTASKEMAWMGTLE